MEHKQLLIAKQNVWLFGVLSLGALILFLIESRIQYDFFKRIYRQDKMQARDLVYDKIYSGRKKSVYFTGLIDSSRVYIPFKKEYKNSSKRISIWYDPVGENAFYREPQEFYYRPFKSNSSRQYVEGFLCFLLPAIIIFTLLIRSYGKYQALKIVWKEQVNG